MSKPTIALVPGAWHTPHHYKPMTDALANAGFPIVNIQHKSLDSPNAKQADAHKDAANIVQAIKPLIDQGKDIVLICHSYGGVPLGEACKGLAKKQGAGGIVGLIWMTAFICKEGVSLFNCLGDAWPPFIEENTETGNLRVTTPKEVFYGDVDQSLTEQSIAALLPQAAAALTTGSGPHGWEDSAFDGRRGYLYCSSDAAIPPPAQMGMMEASGAKWEVKELEASHSPFLSMPDKTAAAVQELIGGFRM